jgi:DeoR/GlpR family transcriptional regulator of sugar metabolism
MEKKFTVFTNSFPVINELINRTNIEFVFLGGEVFPASCITIGVPVIEALQQIRPEAGSNIINHQSKVIRPMLYKLI